MTDLSPAAQAVLDAFTANWQDEPLAQDRQCLAAALRAAAQFNPGPFVPELFDEGWKAAMTELEYIADQLEAQ
jgi:hypothetical protein